MNATTEMNTAANPSTSTATAGDTAAIAVIRARQALAARAAVLRNDNGMSTIEYAMGSLAAAALAAVLYMVINGDGVVDAIEGIITDALSNTPS